MCINLLTKFQIRIFFPKSVKNLMKIMRLIFVCKLMGPVEKFNLSSFKDFLRVVRGQNISFPTLAPLYNIIVGKHAKTVCMMSRVFDIIFELLIKKGSSKTY